MFGSAPATKSTEEQVDLNIDEPEYCSDEIQTSNPLFAMFAFYRYYLMLTADKDEPSKCKYKAIVKFNLDHNAYYSKRDAIIELVDDAEYQLYW